MNYKKLQKKQMTQYDALFKVIIIGDSGVGKTCILRKYVDNLFSTSFVTTIGVDFKVKIIRRGDKNIKLQIWDTAGQERFRTITTSYYRGTDAVILVYDVTDESSFESVEGWIHGMNSKVGSDAIKVLVANKIDNERLRKVPKHKGEKLAQKYNMMFFECSARSSDSSGINIIFENITDTLIPIFFEKKEKNEKLDLAKKKQKECC